MIVIEKYIEVFKKNSLILFARLNDQRARFTKQGKLALERNSIKAQMRGENSVGDLPTRYQSFDERKR